MVEIELRDDGWFEAGKDAEKTFFFAYMCYKDKQELKKKLLELNDKKFGDVSDLEKALKDIKDWNVSGLPTFKRTPYLCGNNIMIDTHGPPGEAYLGQIIKEDKK